MIFVNFLEFLLLLLIIFLIIQIIQSIFLFIYLIQLKEYRLDRIKAHFKTLTGRNQLIDNFNLLKWKKFLYPRLTLRAVLILTVTCLFQYDFFFFVLPFIYSFYPQLPGKILFSTILSLCLIIWLTPIFTLVVSFITNLMFWPIKEIIFYLAAEKRKKMTQLKVIGITGSYGKTATKEIISFLLNKEFKVLKTPMNCNTKLGIAILILRKLRSSHQIFVVEMGAYEKGEIESICQMVGPEIGIITGINEQHLELFGSLKNTIRAKYELIKSLPKDGLAVFNANNKLSLTISRRRKNTRLYGNKRVFHKTGLIGNWYQEPIQAALLIGQYLGLSEKKMTWQLKSLKDFSLAVGIEKGAKGAKIIDDSYSSNPDGFYAALELIDKIPARRKILITPGIIELGAASDKIHQLIGQKAALICQRIILTKKDFYKPINQGIKRIRPEFELEIKEEAQKLVEEIKEELKRNRLILLEGRIPAKIKSALLKN